MQRIPHAPLAPGIFYPLQHFHQSQFLHRYTASSLFLSYSIPQLSSLTTFLFILPLLIQLPWRGQKILEKSSQKILISKNCMMPIICWTFAPNPDMLCCQQGGENVINPSEPNRIFQGGCFPHGRQPLLLPLQ